MKALSASVALISAGVAPSSLAQEATLEEVVVTGIRSSLTRSSEIKRNAAGVVDAISAEDIGKFPDTNLAESLQRITGVSIDRANNEGRQITVRGFGPRFNLVTLNGRSMPTSTSLNELGISRSFNFNEISSAAISAVEVYKTGRADLPTGGIGATVNIRTARPFDYDGFTFAGTAKAIYDTTNENNSDITPDLALILSNTLADDRFGFLVSASYSERDSREEQGTVSGFQRADNGQGVDVGIDSSANQNPNNALFFPRNFNLEVGDTTRERTNAQFVLQFAPTDNLEIDLDYTLSRFKETRLGNSTGFWFGFAGTRFGEARPDGVVNVRDIDQDIDYFGQEQILEAHNDSVGINIDWQVTDRLNLTFDAHTSESESQPDGEFAETIVNIFTLPQVDVGVDFIDGQDIPSLMFDAPFDPFDQANLLPDIALQRGFQVLNEIDEFKLSGQLDFDDSPLTNIKLGASYTDYVYDSDQTFNFVFLTGFDVSQVPFTFIPRGSIGSDFSGSQNLLPTLGFYNAVDAIDLATEQGFFGTAIPSQNAVIEETTAIFASADFEFTLGDMPLNVRAGIRYEETDTTGETTALLPVGLRFRSGAEISTEFSTDFQTESITQSYDVVLPSIDFSLDITDNLKARLSYTETLTRAPLGQLAPGTTVAANNRPGDQNTGVFTATQGNPGLSPAESENIDLSVEWYYKEGSYASLGFFDKTVNAFIETETVLGEVLGANGEPIRNPSANPRPGCPDPVNPACVSDPSDPVVLFNITRPSNSGAEGSITGVELAWQHAFDNGFGFILNYTLADGDVEFDRSDFAAQDPRPLTGLSDSANAVVFYETERFEARVAYNWRDEFLSGFAATNEPTFTDSYQQIDFSASYHINDRSSVFIEGLNVTDETTRLHGRSDVFLRDVFSHGPRFGIGYRAKFF